jgi:hypothetical protein
MIKETLYEESAKSAGATGGTVYSDSYAIAGDIDIGSMAVYLYAKNIAGSSPTLNVTLEYSWNNSTWVASGFAFTQVTTSTNSHEAKLFSTNVYGPYMRVKVVIGGTSTPSYDITVKILCMDGNGMWAVA